MSVRDEILGIFWGRATCCGADLPLCHKCRPLLKDGHQAPKWRILTMERRYGLPWVHDLQYGILDLVWMSHSRHLLIFMENNFC